MVWSYVAVIAWEAFGLIDVYRHPDLVPGDAGMFLMLVFVATFCTLTSKGAAPAMSRSGYTNALDQWDFIRWRGQVVSAIRGQRGQKVLRDLLAALDSLPEKRLIHEQLRNEEGEVCAWGALGAARGLDLETIDPEDSEQVAKAFGVAECMAQEIMYENDEAWGSREDPEKRYQRMSEWLLRQIRSPIASIPTP